MAELAVLDKIKPVLEEGKSARTIEFTEEEQKIVKSLFLLTTKPILYVANVSEDDVADADANHYVQEVRNFAAEENAEVIVVSARAEEEIAELDEEDKAEFLEALGIEESGLDQLIRAAYDLLGLATYFTAGEQEVRAWTFKKESKRRKQQESSIQISNADLSVRKLSLLKTWIIMETCMQQKKLGVFD